MHLPYAGSLCTLSHSFSLLHLLIFILEHEAKLAVCASLFQSYNYWRPQGCPVGLPAQRACLPLPP